MKAVSRLYCVTRSMKVKVLNVFSAKKKSVFVADIFESIATYVLKREFMNADLIVNVYFQKYIKENLKFDVVYTVHHIAMCR